MPTQKPTDKRPFNDPRKIKLNEDKYEKSDEQKDTMDAYNARWQEYSDEYTSHLNYIRDAYEENRRNNG